MHYLTLSLFCSIETFEFFITPHRLHCGQSFMYLSSNQFGIRLDHGSRLGNVTRKNQPPQWLMADHAPMQHYLHRPDYKFPSYRSFTTTGNDHLYCQDASSHLRKLNTRNLNNADCDYHLPLRALIASFISPRFRGLLPRPQVCQASRTGQSRCQLCQY